MRNRYIKIIVPFVLCAALTLTGCTAASGDAEDSAEEEVTLNDQYAPYEDTLDLATDLLPFRIDDISYGGTVPDEYAVEAGDAARYDVTALLGSWCVEGSTSGATEHATETTVKAKFESDDDAIRAFTVLPDTIVFGIGSSGEAVDSIMDMYIYCSAYLLADFSCRSQDDNSFTAMVPYTIGGNTLAVGFYDSSGDDSAVLKQEMDYLMEWTGWKLTLTYGDESVTYVPSEVVDDAENGYVTVGGDIIAGYDGIDGITSVDPDPDNPTVSYGDKTKKATFDFREDGTVTITVKGGETYELEFRYSGKTLTLIDGDHVAMYGYYSY
ncbi:MAG: hypothetical protein LUB60_03550 [Clostridiales bacterium]|nr:hypothetical protein [Clostridiales bacterium]